MSLEFNGAWDHGLIVDSGYYVEEEDCDPSYHQHWVDQLKEAARQLQNQPTPDTTP